MSDVIIGCGIFLQPITIILQGNYLTREKLMIILNKCAKTHIFCTHKNKKEGNEVKKNANI